MSERHLPNLTQLKSEAVQENFTPEEEGILQQLDFQRSVINGSVEYVVHHRARYYLLPHELPVAMRYIEHCERAANGRIR